MNAGTQIKVNAWLDRVLASGTDHDIFMAETRTAEEPFTLDELELIHRLLSIHGEKDALREEISYAVDQGEILPTELSEKGRNMVYNAIVRTRSLIARIYG